MATHSSVLAWRIPGTAEPGGLPSMGSHRVGHDWSDIAAAAAAAAAPLSLRASLVAQMVKHLPALWKIQVWSLGQEDPLEKEMAPHSSILAWRIPWTEEPGGLQSMELQRVGHNWVTSLSLSFSFITTIIPLTLVSSNCFDCSPILRAREHLYLSSHSLWTWYLCWWAEWTNATYS